ncbi:MAG: MerR family transcriptional regulator [Spirochaetae bacterium HGW-Spirochaetae-1]|jgi:DNA-binding transcriptional MerR regulator|nr:MAG: MerR family transcriptional regulator [Spirochaetae bacterium HGW-Spirochaetae-1]
MAENETFTISELASQLDISASTIRFYEEKGLISPARTPGNQRVYNKKDRTRLKLILRGKHFGASLEQISEMIGFADSEINEVSQIQKSLEYIEKRFKDIQQKREELALFEKDLLALRDNLRKRHDELTARKSKKGQ